MFKTDPVPSVFFFLHYDGKEAHSNIWFREEKVADCCRIQLNLQSRNTKLSFLWPVEVYRCSCANFCSLEWTFSFLVSIVASFLVFRLILKPPRASSLMHTSPKVYATVCFQPHPLPLSTKLPLKHMPNHSLLTCQYIQIEVESWLEAGLF